ncbi:MAG: DUF599 domain-containing protein [Alphaproteobacteria bacterium]
MPGFSDLDYVAFAWFAIAWAGYTLYADYSPKRRHSVTAAMNGYRRRWIGEMLKRENRLVDTQTLGNLVTGIGFFASTTILVIGGLFALLGASDAAINALADLPIAIATTRQAWEAKILMMVVIFVYAFFKFAWAYRLSNYCAIMIGSAPPRGECDEAVTDSYVTRLGRVTNLMGLHFNRGLRSYFFALAGLGWFVHPLLFVVAVSWVLFVLYRRDFRSREFHLLGGGQGGNLSDVARDV